MQGDFSRNTFDPNNQFTRVLMQQGRVQIDADWNEQVSILLHQLRIMATDIIGQYGVPSGQSDGFKIELDGETFKILPGRIYVDGLLCTNSSEITYHNQPHCAANDELSDGPYLVYLDVWEQHLTHHETDVAIREVALNGADTATRAKLVWQVRVLNEYLAFKRKEEDESVYERDSDGNLILHEGPVEVPNIADESANKDDLIKFCKHWLEDQAEQEANRGLMNAWVGEAQKDKKDNEACTISPDAAYRGVENQLYRVEIHEGSENGRIGTFKFSRENGSVIFPLAKEKEGNIVTVQHLGRDGRLSLKEGDWVEMIDDDTKLSIAAPEPLLQVTHINAMKRTVTLSGTPRAGSTLAKHPFLRRWDQRDSTDLRLNACGVVKITGESANDQTSSQFYSLEKGIQIQFEFGQNSKFRRGDYWLIPARVATGKIEWPYKEAIPPHGVTHHYAPLAIVSDGKPAHDCRKLFKPLCQTSELEAPAKPAEGGGG